MNFSSPTWRVYRRVGSHWQCSCHWLASEMTRKRYQAGTHQWCVLCCSGPAAWGWPVDKCSHVILHFIPTQTYGQDFVRMLKKGVNQRKWKRWKSMIGKPSGYVSIIIYKVLHFTIQCQCVLYGHNTFKKQCLLLPCYYYHIIITI